MEYTFEVKVKLKPGIIDAEGETVRKALELLGYKVSKVKSVKVYVISIRSSSKEEAIEEVEEMCKRLLANPVIQEYEIKAIEK
ncbi:MAG TPA: phosphoribosylformylglycinamidine synthase, purS protein [Candidatus Altiarchaeales archaeon]|nr:phosphoribosylformylglycinamidine synthase, purS protein [Candidatus Altiarchaeales archaeon]